MKYSYIKALALIALSTVLVCGPAVATFTYHYLQRQKRRANPANNIVGIIQTGPQKEQLPTALLAELLDLSTDKPTNLYAFNIKEGEKKLVASPLIKEAMIKRVPPTTLYVEYAIRQPIAYCGDATNTLIDTEGYLIPDKPFFTPKVLPTLYLGKHAYTQLAWGCRLAEKKLLLAYEILHLIDAKVDSRLHLSSVDLSDEAHLHCGHRQIVIKFVLPYIKDRDRKEKAIYLRLSPDNIDVAIDRFCLLLHHGTFKVAADQVADLRLDQLAYIAPL